MSRYDALPPELRHWLSQAALPWSARSVRRAWQAALTQSSGDPARATLLLTELESRRLRKDALQVWGATHPAAHPDARPHHAT